MFQKVLDFNTLSNFFLFVVCEDLRHQSLTTNKEDNYWIKELCLFETDREFLRGGKWLSDAVVTASQHLLKELYPHVGGLQPTTLGLTLGFDVQRTEFDCGVFAIAFATSLCAGHSPAKTTYIQHLLQPHLLQCLEDGVFTKFLSLQRNEK